MLCARGAKPRLRPSCSIFSYAGAGNDGSRCHPSPGQAAVMDAETYKREAARRALEFLRPGMRLGLGTGSTARHFVELLAERAAAGLDVICVPTSEATRQQAQSLGLKLTTLDDSPTLDLTVD